mgnify:FL=1|tara:strand:- start:5320 stop:5709 length:390 start_codon:yes stop_codon:yes gene_type:complete
MSLKIGTKFEECIRDIVTEKVDITTVLLILDYGGYNFEHSDDWEECWSYHSHPSGFWYGLDKDKVWYTIDTLYFDKKLHTYGSIPMPAWRFPWMEIIIPNQYLDEIPQLRQLWEEYCVLAKLATPADKY